MVNFLIKSGFLALCIMVFCGQVFAKDKVAKHKEWNAFSWTVDEGSFVARVLSPYKLEDMPRFGIDFQGSEKEKSARWSFSSQGLIAQNKVPFTNFENTALKKILLDKAHEMFDEQKKESQSVIDRGIKDRNVMLELGENYLVPFDIIDQVKNKFKENPSEFVTIYESPLYGKLKAIVGEIAIAYTGKDYRSHEETHIEKIIYIFLVSNDEQIAMREFSNNCGYALFKNKDGQIFFLVHRCGYEGDGIESYLIDSEGLKLVASVGGGL